MNTWMLRCCQWLVKLPRPSDGQKEQCMKLFAKLIDNVRTITGVRRARQLSQSKEKPPAGTSIVRENLRMRIRYPIDDELWQWLLSMDWRAMPLSNNRRRYRLVAEKVVLKLFKADQAERQAMHNKLIGSPSEASRIGQQH